jgi:YD repeat-containing protein
VLNEGTTPTWASPYCAGAPGLRTCLLLHDADASVQLFALDYMTGLYMPQAGSTDTVAEAVGGGWALRRANGAILMFNREGYLVQDRDRFGNGFSIDYEPTPLFELFKAYCDESYTATVSRACLVLGAMLEFIREPDSSSPNWNLSASDFRTPWPITLEEAQARGRLRNYFLGLLKQGTEISATLATSAFGSKSTFGARRLRPTKVTDDLGRTLMFAYNRGARPSPDDELLREVSGPAGTKLVFTYSRPPGSPISPEKLNEEFLVRVDRTDTPIGPELLAAPTRQIAYGYQWPDVPGSLTSAQLAQYAEAVRDPYYSYYRSFIGCWRPGQRCGGGGSGPPSIDLASVPGDPALLAEEQVREYLSDVFDNIIKVDQTGVTESETRYHSDPARLDFDRVSAQRYGATQAQASAVALPPESPPSTWTTTLPRMTFAYASAGPLSTGGDRTDAFLPAEILARYPLQTPPAPLEPVVVPPHAAAGSDETCHLDWLGGLRAALPGYRGVYKYYQDAPRFHVAGLLAAAAQLMRTPLSCDTLALAQMSDPTHNDLLSELDPIPNPGGGTSEIGTARRIVGQRVRIAADANRICGWSKVVDRDGDLHYHGLNYRGQALVNAVLERATGSFIYSERLYNADGNLVIDRRPTRGQRPWTTSDGYTLYSYDEKRLTGGSEPLNDWLPVFWSRRANLQAVTEFARGGSVTDIAQAASVVATTSVGRYKQMSYEPLFNQLLSVEEGSFGLFSRSPHSRTDYVFDYQELSLTSLKPILDELRPWGFRWSETTGPPPDYDYPAIQWQLPVTFYGADLNGDGKVGLYGSASARGVPVLAVRTGENGERQEYAMTWAPHGKPAGIAGPDGSLVLFDYYSVAAAGQGPYGLGARPAESEVSGGNRSFLGRVRTRRFAPAYVSGFGPTAAPCASLAGPYQWLLPSSCSSNPGVDLVMLGLAPEAVSAITRTVRGAVPDKWQTSSFGYSVLGKVSRSWSDTGEVSVIRDADGRERAVTDELGSLTVNTYDQQGLPTFTVRTDKFGAQIGATRRQFDDEGKLSYRCNAKGANGCTVVGRMAAPDGVEERFEYGPEGTLNLEVDGEGLRAVHQYDERQQLRKSVASKPRTPGTREVAYQYNLDGDVENVRHGDATTFLGERMEYDGLRRLKRYVDKRGYSWHLGHSDRDLLSRYKQDADTATYSSGVSTGKWESTFEYDGLHRLSKRTDNGVASTTYSRTNAGNVYRVDRTGLGASYTTYDSQGQPVWESDGAPTLVLLEGPGKPLLGVEVEPEVVRAALDSLIA